MEDFSLPYGNGSRALRGVKLLVSQALAGSRQVVMVPENSRQAFSFLPKRYNTENTLLLVNLGNNLYLAKAARMGSSAGDRLLQEIKWYENAYTKALKLIDYCPEYIGSFIERGELILIVKFIQNASTMRESLINHRLPVEEAVCVIKDLFKVLDLEIGRYSLLEKGQLHKSLRNRIRARATLIQNALAGSKFGANYWDTSVAINGLPAANLAEVFQWLNCYSRYLIDPRVSVRGIAHGDLHFENILLQQNRKCFLVDPNYEVSAIPIYDLGKLVQSISGLYDLIHYGDFTVECPSERELNLSFIGDGPSAFRELANHLPQLFDYITNDRELTANLLEQAEVMCLAHFFCLLPHHIQDRTKFLALIARTITLFHEIKSKAK